MRENEVHTHTQTHTYTRRIEKPLPSDRISVSAPLARAQPIAVFYRYSSELWLHIYIYTRRTVRSRELYMYRWGARELVREHICVPAATAKNELVREEAARMALLRDRWPLGGLSVLRSAHVYVWVCVCIRLYIYTRRRGGGRRRRVESDTENSHRMHRLKLRDGARALCIYIQVYIL